MTIKVALICPSSLLHMPYAREYISKISTLGDVDLSVITWDRFKIEDNAEFIYRDNQVGHRRNLIQYYLFGRFVKKAIQSISPDRVIIFGIPLVFILTKLIALNFRVKSYVIDIRDYHKCIRFFDIKEAIQRSYFTVLSSPGFVKWLPEIDRYIVHHNDSMKTHEISSGIGRVRNGAPIVISCIGALKDAEVNYALIDRLADNKLFKLRYDGEGIVNKHLNAYLNKKRIKNVEVTGRYLPENEYLLYRQADIINMLMSKGHINNETCLSNRLYRSLVFGKPLVVLSESLIAELVQRYNLGLVVDSIIDIDTKIASYLQNFDLIKYNKGRSEFAKVVDSDNRVFETKLREFIFQK